MVKKLILLGVLFIASLSGANAATITLNKGLATGYNLVSTTNSVQTTGYTIFLGTFSTAPVTPVGGNYTSIVSAFQIYGAGGVAGAGIGVLDPITGSFASNVASTVTFNNALMYIMIANNTNLASATEIAIFKNTTPSFFPSDVSSGSATANFAMGGGTALSVVAGAGSVVDNASGVDNLGYILVPEPSTMFLGAIGALVLFRRRRV